MVLQEFFNICLMKSLQLLDLCFILLSLASNDLTSCEFAKFNCNNYHVKLGENASILCKSNKEITRVKVTFCSHYNDSCPEESSIDTEKGLNATENGRISLKKKNNTLYYLNIHNVEIFDNRKYQFCILTDAGYRCEQACLEVTALYTIDEVKLQNNTTIVCKASGGFPQSQLYWYDKNGINLTSSSKLETKKAPNGSFFLSSTLQVESPIDKIYCCTLNNTTCLDTDFVWTAPEVSTFVKLKSKEHAVSTCILVAVGVLVAIGVGAAIFHRRKKGANYVNWQRVNKTLPNQREQI